MFVLKFIVLLGFSYRGYVVEKGDMNYEYIIDGESG
jgi:hypothetical protein